MLDTQVQVDLLGHVRVRVEHEELQLGPARQRAILAVLALSPGRLVSRDELILNVWGNSPPPSVGGNVHTYVSGLRRVLEPERALWSGGDVLVSEPPGYRLRLPSHNIDLFRFHRLQGQAGELQAAGDLAGVVRCLDSALALWRGEALSGVPGPFVERHRVELSEKRLVLVEQRYQNLLAMGEHSDLIPELEALAHEHPLRESLWESLITALQRGGRRMEALDRIAHLRGVLREELGVQPGAAIRLLHEELLMGDLTLPASEPTIGRSKPEFLSVVPDNIARSQLVGRDPLIAMLRSYISEAELRRGRVVLVEGETGIGKSALLSAALASVDPLRYHLAWAQADGRQTVPLGVLRWALGLGRYGSVSTNEVLKRVEQLCTNAPLVLVVDDLHEADEASLLVWDQLSLATRSLPLLMIATSRNDVAAEAFAPLRRGMVARDDVIVRLGPLTQASSSHFIHQAIGATPGPGLQALATTAQGNPLALRQMIASLHHENAIRTAGGVVDLRADDAVSVERALVAWMTARLDRLSSITLETLRAAAVLGMRFTPCEIAALVGSRPSQLVEVLNEAIHARVITNAGENLVFTHSALRRAFHESTPRNLLAALHRKAARSLMDAGAQDERICEQLAAVDEGRLPPWAVDWLIAHDVETAACEPLSKVWLLTQALETCAVGDPRRGALLTIRARVLEQIVA